jgi:hypothetical protein
MNLNSLKKHFLFFIILILFYNCSGDKELPIPENAVFEPQTELISLTGNNNQLKLIWKPVIIKKFKSYKVYRLNSYTDKYMSPAAIVYSGELIYESTNYLKNEYTDNKIPFDSYISYAVVTEYINEVNKVEGFVSANYLSYENKDLSFSLTSLVKLEDGSLRLEWEKDANVGFENYSIYAVNDDYLNKEEDFNNEKLLKVSNNQNTNFIIDNTPYTKGQVFYAVSKVINGKRIRSKNYLSIQNPRTLNFKPTQTLKNPYNKNEIIIINSEGGEVLFYNIKSLGYDKILTNGQIYYCSIGNYQGVEDLYVPSKDGNVFVIDLATHKIKVTINLITDYNILSVIPINGNLLFLEKHAYADIGGMLVYNRLTNKVLNRNGSYTMSFNSKLIYAKENYFFNVWNDGLEYGSSSAISRLNINGNQVSTDNLFNYSVADSRLFALADDKTFFVSTKYGYQSDVNYENFTEVTTNKYYQDGFFGDAKIDSDNKHIYFTVPDISQIEVFEKNNFTKIIKQYKTNGIPLLLEIFQNEIISLNQLKNNYYIETIVK